MDQKEKIKIVERLEDKSYRKRKFLDIRTAIIGILVILSGVVLIALNNTTLMIIGAILSGLGVITVIVAAIKSSKNPDL